MWAKSSKSTRRGQQKTLGMVTTTFICAILAKKFFHNWVAKFPSKST
jgi:hypothetical protein